MSKIGILGGSFNPIHNLHIELALAALKDYSLDKVLIMPTRKPPHKQLAEGASDIDRVEMIKRVISKYEDFELDLFEMNAKEQTYTYKTLSIYKEKYKEDDLFFIIGEDSLDKFDTWKNPDIICQKATLLVGPRANTKEDKSFDEKLKERSLQFNGTFLKLSSPRLDVSSTIVRDKIAAKDDFEKMVPKEVSSYIKSKGIYNYV